MTTKPDFLETVSSLARSRWVWLLLLIALPCLVSLGYFTWGQRVTQAQQREVCRSFVLGQPGWRTQDVTLQEALALEPDARGAFMGQMNHALKGLEHPMPAGRLRLFALPVWGKVDYFYPQQLVGTLIRLDGTAHHSLPEASLLFVDLPWVGGAYEALDVTGPCGTYRQRFELLLSSDTQGTVTVSTLQSGQVVARWQIAVQR